MSTTTEPLDGDLPPFCWLQQRVTVITHSEEITGRLMMVGSPHGREGFSYLVVHDDTTTADIPVYIPNVGNISSVFPVVEVKEAPGIEVDEVDEELDAFK